MSNSHSSIGTQSVRAGPRALALLLAGMLLTACATKTTELAAGGFAAGDGGRLSLAVAQSRAQFPELSARDLPYAMRESKDGATALELAMQGAGVGFSRGLQLKERTKGSIKLYLDKATYGRGHAVVQLEGGAEETWPIVAYELRGKASERFEFSYLLATPSGGLRYLVILGGNYTDAGKELLAYEGTLFVPTPGKPLDEWSRAFKFDFGYKYPARPDYLAGVDEAESLFRELQRDVSAIQTQNERVTKTQNDASAAKSAGVGSAARRGPDPAVLEARAGELRSQLTQKVAETEAKALHYYEVRTTVDNAYAAFVLTNPYTWRDVAGKAEHYKRWQKVEFHHPVIDKLVEALVTFLPDPKRLETARSQAMALFAKNNNWDKNPEGKESPPGETPVKGGKPAGSM